MEEIKKADRIKAPWRNKFLNVLERTFTELNLEFTNFSIGQVSNGEFKKRYFDTDIQGIEFADELTVCSEIVNDCLASSLLNGTIDPDNPEEFKFYNVKREERLNDDNQQRIDIVLQRVHQKHIFKLAAGKIPTEEEPEVDFEPVYIEAKRAKTYPNKKLTQDFISGILTKIELDKFNFDKKRFNYILVWGVWNNGDEIKNIPQNYLDKLDNSNYEFEKFVRWIPISWEREDKIDPPKEFKTTRWCWILLAEVTKKV